jgi:hypothetical protein
MLAPPRRLLLLACSQRKRTGPSELPAIERYDGPPYRVLRRYLRSGNEDQPDIHILSAEYGLIPLDQPIKYYDRKMSPARARELNVATIARLRSIIQPDLYHEIMVSMGSTYLRALDGWTSIIPEGVTVWIARGGLGRKLTALRDWLYGDTTARNLHRLRIEVKCI